MPITPQDVADALTAAGLDTPEKFAALLSGAVKPLQRAAIQSAIDAARKEFEAATQAHNATLTDLQAKLNAV